MIICFWWQNVSFNISVSPGRSISWQINQTFSAQVQQLSQSVFSQKFNFCLKFKLIYIHITVYLPWKAKIKDCGSFTWASFWELRKLSKAMKLSLGSFLRHQQPDYYRSHRLQKPHSLSYTPIKIEIQSLKECACVLYLSAFAGTFFRTFRFFMYCNRPITHLC